MIEIFRPEDGMEFRDKDELGRPIHAYLLKGERIPFSLTQILSLAGLSNSYSSVDPTVLSNKARLGTRVHEYTLWDDKDDLDIEDLKPNLNYYNRVLGWRQFKEDFGFMPDLTSCEVPIGVKIDGMTWAMKLDAYGVMGDGDSTSLAVVEKKCSCDMEASYSVQTAAQAIPFRNHGESVDIPLKRFVVQLLDKPNGSGRCYKAQEHKGEEDEKVFLSALTTVHWRYNKGLLKGQP